MTRFNPDVSVKNPEDGAFMAMVYSIGATAVSLGFAKAGDVIHDPAMKWSALGAAIVTWLSAAYYGNQSELGQPIPDPTPEQQS